MQNSHNRTRIRTIAKYLETAVLATFIGAAVINLGPAHATAAPLPLAPIGGTGSANFPSLPLSESAYTGSAGSSDNKAARPLPIADSGSSGSGESGSGLGSAGSDGNIAAPGNDNTLSSGWVGDGSSESGNRNTTEPLALGPTHDTVPLN